MAPAVLLIALLACGAAAEAAATTAAPGRRLAALGGPLMTSCPPGQGGARACRDAYAFAAQADDQAGRLFARRCNDPGREYGPPNCVASPPAGGFRGGTGGAGPPRRQQQQVTCSGKGNGDAFRNAYWNALMSFYLGSDAAASFANQGANQACSRPQRARANQPLDVQMDCANGQSGRQLGTSWNSTATRQSYPFDAERRDRRISRAVQDAVGGGRLVRLVRFGGTAKDYSQQGAYELVPTSKECFLA